MLGLGVCSDEQGRIVKNFCYLIDLSILVVILMATQIKEKIKNVIFLSVP